MEIEGACGDCVYVRFRGRGGDNLRGFNLQIIMFNKKTPD
jgi:hypothetical protein